MKWLHKLAHLLEMNSEFVDMYQENGIVWAGNRCNTCGQVDNPKSICSLEQFEKSFGAGQIKKTDSNT